MINSNKKMRGKRRAAPRHLTGVAKPGAVHLWVSLELGAGGELNNLLIKSQT